MDAERRVDWPHWPDRANGAARRNRLERRLFRDSEREDAIERTHAAINQLELATAAKAAQIERLEDAVAESNGAAAAEPEPEREAEPAYLIFVWTPDGYGLRAAEGAAPEAGTRLSIAGAEHVVAKLGPSPLPGDRRRCAYLEPA